MSELTAEQAYAAHHGLIRGGPTEWRTAEGEPIDIRAEPGYERFATAYDSPNPTLDQPPQDDRR